MRQGERGGDIEEVRKIRWKNFDYGYSILSNLITTIREPRPEIAVNSRFLRRHAAVSIALYEHLRRYLRVQQPDRVYAFNGRFCLPRAVIRACEAEGIDYVGCWAGVSKTCWTSRLPKNLCISSGMVDT